MRIKLSLKILILVVLLFQFTGSVYVGFASQHNQDSEVDPRVQKLLDELTPEEKIGQLFLITFTGIDASTQSQIYDLIANKHIGGVVLKASNDNFVAAPDTVNSAWELNRELQTIEYLSSLGELIENDSGESISSRYIPLFIGISQGGGGYPNDEIFYGLTELPSPMAVAATWQPELAKQVGEILGRELSGLGFNLLMGPSLDLLNVPNPESAGDLGTASFGGNPFWVGEMARAYISGINSGSGGRIATVAKHLPGQGGLDLPVEFEIPTVRKTIEQLSSTELIPFFAVTDDDNVEGSNVAAMLLSHIRYEGFQGVIRPTTRPVSLDPQAFIELMNLPEFEKWRSSGGVIISDDLGTRAIKRFFDPSGQNFTRVLARDVAREAFLAGNDLLYLGDFITVGDVDNYRTIIDTLEFFTQKYREDTAFAQRVDESLIRILTLKFNIYNEFIIQSVVPTEAGLTKISPDSQISFDISSQSVTLLSPALSELDNAIPTLPDISTRMIFFTDTAEIKQCSTCPEQEFIAVDALARAVNRLYGPLASGQVFPERLLSYHMTDLAQLLASNAIDQPLTPLVDGADWLVFLIRDVDPNRPASLLLRQFLAERQDIIQDKNIIVFALGAPYYLNATEISKMTAYYGLYSKETEFINVAARLLFKEIPLPGSSPVTIAGTGYDLDAVTLPNINQDIKLFVNSNLEDSAIISLPPESGTSINFGVGEIITFQTDIILDYNGNQVPNGTVVNFNISTTLEGTSTDREESSITVAGVAQTTIRLDTPGSLTIQVFSGEPAAQSVLIQLDILSNDIAITNEDVVDPATSEPAAEVVPTEENAPTAAITASTQTTLGDWSLSVLTTLFVGLFAYQSGVNSGKVTWGLRWSMTAIIGGLLMNVYLAFGLPGTVWILSSAEIWGVLIFVLGSAFIGWGVGWFWWRSSKPS